MNDLDHALRALADELAFKAPDRARIDIERLETNLSESGRQAFRVQRHAALEHYKQQYVVGLKARRSAA